MLECRSDGGIVWEEKAELPLWRNKLMMWKKRSLIELFPKLHLGWQDMLFKLNISGKYWELLCNQTPYTQRLPVHMVRDIWWTVTVLLCRLCHPPSAVFRRDTNTAETAAFPSHTLPFPAQIPSRPAFFINPPSSTAVMPFSVKYIGEERQSWDSHPWLRWLICIPDAQKSCVFSSYFLLSPYFLCSS